MTEIRGLCDQMIEMSPPMRDSATVLAAARRSLARRRAGLAGAGALAVVVTTTAVLTLTSTLAGAPTDRSAVGDASSRTASASERAPAPAPQPLARAAFTHSQQMRQLLLAQIPNGYTTTSLPVTDDKGFDPTAVLPNEKYPAPKGGALLIAFAGEFLDADGGEGMLSATIFASADPAPASPCLATPQGRNCHLITVNGVEVEVTTWHDQAGQHISAVRRLRGGSLMVIASQGLSPGDAGRPKDTTSGLHATTKPPLATLPFSEAQIASLAANPAMLQFP